MATSSKPSHDVFGLGLGLLSWVFPNVSIWVKIAVTVTIIGLILFLSLSKDKRDQTLSAVGNFSDRALTDFIVPAIGGGFRGLFISLIGVFIMDNLLHIHLIHHESNSILPGSNSGGIVKLFLHTLGNLNDAGAAVVIIAVIIGAFSKIGDAEAKRDEIILNSWKTEYTLATFKGASRFLWTVILKFDFSYNGKTYLHREYDLKKRPDLGKTMYRIKFSPENPKIARIIWNESVPVVTGPPPLTGDSTKAPS